jgi:hypothetical protein
MGSPRQLMPVHEPVETLQTNVWRSADIVEAFADIVET